MTSNTAVARAGKHPSTNDSYGIVFIVGLIVLVSFVILTLVAVQRASYDTWASLIVTPVLVLVSLPAFARQAAREGNKKIFWLLLGALILKLIAGTFLRYFNTVEINGGTDSNKYHFAGLELFESFRNFDFETGFGRSTGTNFIRLVTAIVYAIVGPSRAAGFIVFSWFGFWGAYYFYRAFVIAIPNGSKATYGRYVFLLPSILFWPSSLGKEAWMMLATGVTAYGVALLLTGATVRGAGATVIGSWLASFVRPYFPAMMIMALAFAYLFRRRKEGKKQFAPVTKAIILGGLVFVSLGLITKSEEFLAERKLDTSEGIAATTEELTRRSSQGGSEFTPTVVSSPAQFPVAAITVLFRPLLVEAHTLRAAFAALEGTILLGLCLWRLPWILAALKSFQKQPYVIFASAYTCLFIVAYSTVANFGLLVRQRSLVLPVFLVLLSIPSAAARKRLDAKKQNSPTPAPTTF